MRALPKIPAIFHVRQKIAIAIVKNRDAWCIELRRYFESLPLAGYLIVSLMCLSFLKQLFALAGSDQHAITTQQVTLAELTALCAERLRRSK